MRLSNEQIIEIVVGAVDHWIDEAGLHFTKYTPQQLTAWEQTAPYLVDNLKATTGIRLDFHTDAAEVIFEMTGGRNFEVKVDGMLTHQFKTDGEAEGGTFTVNLGKPGEMKHVVFSFPSHGKPGILRSVCVEDGAKVLPHSFDKKLLFLGDSITQGWESTFDLQSYAYRVSEAMNAESVIYGIGGAFFEPKVPCSMPYDPDVVFVAYGTNDYNNFKTLVEIKSRAAAYLQSVKEQYQDAQIYVITPTWRTDYDTPKESGYFQECCDSIGEIAKSLGLTVIDGMALVPHCAEFLSDYVHPNLSGHGMYAQNLLKQIKE